MPTWIQLQYAISIEKHRHFGKAARACHVSQPTLSQQLQKLEDEVEIILFDRTKKPILPTPEGQLFLEQARVVLREQEKLIQVARRSRMGEVAGDFRLGVIPTVSGDLLPLFLKPFSIGFPKVNLYIEELKTEMVLQELAGDRLDGAILATPIAERDFNSHPLYYESFYVYFSVGHRLLQQAEISRSDLDACEMWLLQDGHCFRDQVLSFCAVTGRSELSLGNIHFQSGSLDTLRRLVQVNQGFTLIPALMALSLGRKERDAHLRPFRPPLPAREISLIYRRDHWKLAIIRAIEDTIARCVPEALPRVPVKAMKVLQAC